MVQVPAQAKILVTGASGFIGAQTVEAFLRRGFSVRGTVRSASKGKYLDNLFDSIGFKSTWEWVIVTDIEKPDGFNEAVKGVQGIAHVASPFHYDTGPDPYTAIINPAVNGTLSILRAAKLHGADVKRIVITSSNAAIRNSGFKAPFTMTEEIWNVEDPEILKKEGKDAPGGVVYRASKTLAERAAWNFIEEEKPNFDIVTLQPPLVFGPITQEVNGPGSLNTSVKQVWEHASGIPSLEGAEKSAGNMVDVRDLAEAHVQALVVPDAGGERFAISNSPYAWQDILDQLSKKIDKSDEMKTLFSKFNPGNPGAGKGQPAVVLSSEKSQRVLGMKYRSLEDTIDATIDALVERNRQGWN